MSDQLPPTEEEMERWHVKALQTPIQHGDNEHAVLRLVDEVYRLRQRVNKAESDRRRWDWWFGSDCWPSDYAPNGSIHWTSDQWRAWADKQIALEGDK